MWPALPNTAVRCLSREWLTQEIADESFEILLDDVKVGLDAFLLARLGLHLCHVGVDLPHDLVLATGLLIQFDA